MSSSSPTAIAAPDSLRYYGGRTLRQFVLDPGDGIVADAAGRVENPSDVYPSNEATGAAWVHWYIEPAGANPLPADGALQAYLHHSSGAEYGPVNMVRDTASVLRRSNGGAFYRARIKINQASEGYLDFTPRIMNASGQQLTFNAYRVAMTSEPWRLYGWHCCWVPKRTVTGPQYNDAAWEQIFGVVNELSVQEGIWVYRFVLPYALTDLCNLNGNATDADQTNRFNPCLWQSGPQGEATTSFNCDLNVAVDNQSMSIQISMQRGLAGYLGWDAFVNTIPINPANFPAFTPIDIALAWHLGQVVAFGIGQGTGTGITWLNNGDTFCGGTVAISSQTGTVWELDAEVDSHLGFGSDRDTTREFGGWIQAVAAGKTVSPATVKTSIEVQIASRLGARKSYA